MGSLTAPPSFDWLVLYSLNSALRREEAMGERMEAVLAVLFPEEEGEIA